METTTTTRTRAEHLAVARRASNLARRVSTNYRHEGRKQHISADLEQQRFDIEHHQVIEKSFPWKPRLRLLLIGARDERSPLSLLRDYEDTIIKHIYTFLFEFWKTCVIRTTPAAFVGRIELTVDEQDEFAIGPNGSRVRASNVLAAFGCYHYVFLGGMKKDRPRISFASCGLVVFPPAQDRNVNMLPFIMGDKFSLPENLQPYYDTVIGRCPVEESEIGKVVYLTVMESFVKADQTQRRPGLHVEAPGTFTTEASFTAALEERWGGGIAYSPDELHGGLFVATNMAHTCKVWNALVTKSRAVDSLGGIEPLRRFIGNGYELEPWELVWLTDKTPHEALAQREDGYRQFFRLVTSDISVWFADHSTPNPNVPLPNFVRVVRGNKFTSANFSSLCDNKVHYIHNNT